MRSHTSGHQAQTSYRKKLSMQTMISHFTSDTINAAISVYSAQSIEHDMNSAQQMSHISHVQFFRVLETSR